MSSGGGADEVLEWEMLRAEEERDGIRPKRTRCVSDDEENDLNVTGGAGVRTEGAAPASNAENTIRRRPKRRAKRRRHDGGGGGANDDDGANGDFVESASGDAQDDYQDFDADEEEEDAQDFEEGEEEEDEEISEEEDEVDGEGNGLEPDVEQFMEDVRTGDNDVMADIEGDEEDGDDVMNDGADEESVESFSPLPMLQLLAQTPMSEFSSIAAYVYTQMQPYINLPYLEVEVRLCTLAERRHGRRLQLPILSPAVAVPGRTSVEVGVLQSDFRYLRSTLLKAAVDLRAGLKRAGDVHSESVLISRSGCKDLRVGQSRYSMTLEEPSQLIACSDKKRLTIVDILVPMMRYDLRIAMSQEIPVVDAPPPPSWLTVTTPSHSENNSGRPDERSRGEGKVDHVRVKARETVRSGCLLYDMTEVTSSRGPPTFEVEIEGLFNDASREITPAWVNHLLTSAMLLLNHLNSP